MANSSHFALQRRCHCQQDKMSILYHILNHRRHLYLPPCSCREKVALGSPFVAGKAASEVLLKTVYFIKNLPSFRGLSKADQLLLLENCWAALFVLGLAQEGVDFEVAGPSNTSILKEILMKQRVAAAESEERTGSEPTAAEVQRVKAFLAQCWRMDFSTKEYVYLKGVVLFSPDVSGLRCPQHILCLQQEAEQALTEHTQCIHQQDTRRHGQIELALASLRGISPHIVTQLFFRPLIGNVQMNALLVEMLSAS
ncbi:nuclear receptor subfamily 0 group B member 1-like [Amblyraja radiata]|uniref:nuclear receptor subfamily 0 group B member 1-like n=1 Tax=Amblyraja radiata TaxID=386614 RepID=UPI00140209F1|nr:nuclear receptor subfamily 0 group B member 1-like [Amblyraja radiata]